jgi:hypothetical protein
MGYERPMFFKLAKPQSLDLGIIGLDAQEEAANSQVRFGPGVGPSGGTLLNSKIMGKRVHVGGV